MPDCSLGSVAAIPASRSVAGASSPAPAARISSAGAPSWRSIQWSTSGMESPSSAAAWTKVDRRAPARSLQWCSPERDVIRRLAPTIASAVTTAASQLLAVVSGDQPTRSTSRRAVDLAARVVEERPTVAAARGRGGAHDVGLGRGRDDRPFGQQNIGYDQGGCLTGARRAQDQGRALCAGPHPSVATGPNIDAVVRIAVDPTQCCSRMQARIRCIDMHVSVVFHGSDVCVGEQTIPEDISPNAATIERCCARAGAVCTSIVCRETCESKVMHERKMTARTKNA